MGSIADRVKARLGIDKKLQEARDAESGGKDDEAAPVREPKPKKIKRQRKCCPTMQGKPHDESVCVHSAAKPKKDKVPTLKSRLPHGAIFKAIYDADKEQWTGMFEINGVIIEGSASAIFKLLRNLDDKYRSNALTPSEEAVPSN